MLAEGARCPHCGKKPGYEHPRYVHINRLSIILPLLFNIATGDFFTIAPQIIEQIQTWPDMVDENEIIAANPLVSFHKISGELISGPTAFNWRGKGEPSKDDNRPLPSRIYRHNRPKFVKMLCSQLERIGVKVEYGHRVVDYYEDENKAGIVLGNGDKLEADVVIAADGIGTKSHKLISGHDIRAWGSGLAIFRTAFPVEMILADDEINSRFCMLEDGHSNAELWNGSVYLVRDGQNNTNSTLDPTYSSLY
jgi:glycine/D-amino acid oxidase-like deaminating enzyme